MQALLRWFLFAVALLALGTLGACSVQTAGVEMPDGTGASGPTGGSGGATLMLAFSESDPLVLAPSAAKEITVTVTPADQPRAVRFALIDFGNVGAVADASLNLTETTTDINGMARVTLTAPSIPTEFGLRALVETTQRTLTVQVGANGLETLVVEPSYVGGRSVTEWVAAVYDDGRTCADLEGNPPQGDGPKFSVTVPSDEPIRIDDVRVGVKLAVTLRAGYFAGGCSGVDALVEGQPNTVLVTVTNRPIQLDRSEVVLTLGLEGQEAELASGMESVIEAAQNALLGAAQIDSEALLDAMEEEATVSALCSRFGTARESNAWDAELAATLGIQATASIRDDLGDWLAAGVPSLARDDAFVATLVADPDTMGGALLEPASFAEFDARDAGFPESVTATWTADAHDNVVLGTTITFNPAALLVLAADAPAVMDMPEASDLAEALALSGERCATVTATLTSRGQGVGQSCVGCDAACTRLVCERGVARLVARASAALVEEPAALRVAATGGAEVGEQAELQALDGSWVGALDAANRSSQLAGALSAEGAY